MQVSLITCTNNSEKTIKDCCLSIFSQTHKDIEHIIIDNNSYELTVDNKVSISEIINSFNNNKINVIEILSKRNKLEELFMELTQE